MTKIFLVAGETSGDMLGAALMRALRLAEPSVGFAGVGGREMTAAGLASLFPLEDIAVMGLTPVLARLPLLARRLDETVRAVLADPPDCLLLIDAPDFTHRVARRVRAANPAVRIVDYVCPSVWAWRPGRARAMRAYVDRVLAILPFEPAALAKLGGPPCDYVGHPLVERLDEFSRGAEDVEERPLLVVLPGSREAEVRRMTPLYGEVVALLRREFPALDVVVPPTEALEALVKAETARWPFPPRLLRQSEKLAAFRRARAALATSGVVTLELALARTPMAVAYRVSAPESLLRPLVKVENFALPNLILGRSAEDRAVPEFLQQDARPEALAAALAKLLRGGGEREAQLAAFEALRAEMLSAGLKPSRRAAEIVLSPARGGEKSRG
ncbi:MAG TPA: lipid-A-disaccharide synthase [Methylocystis sp.]|nr:lipid-A-disaccharide synthase [Methylocystis sp.]